MKVSEAFPSRFLKADTDIPKDGMLVQIKDIDTEMLGDERKVIVSFKGLDKALVLNKTNAALLTSICESDDMDDWYGQRITLVKERTPFRGEMVWTIRVKEAPAKEAKTKAASKSEAELDDTPF